MRPPDDRYSRYDDYDDEDPEIEEINRSSASSTFLQRRWWRWLALVMAALLLLSFAAPLLLPLLDRGNQSPLGPQAPDFTLESPNAGTVTLSQQVADHDYVIVLFYRTYN